MEGLPKLPGLDFENRLKLRHSVPHCFNYINGYRIPIKPKIGIGGDVLKEDSIEYCKQNDTILYDPALTYGYVKQLPIQPFRPHFVKYDKIVLTFYGFFKQCIPESNEEHYRIRNVNIMYFMEDDSITVMEPTILNCGYPQGRIVRRGKIQKNTIGQFYTWKDFNIGIDIEFFGIVYHITDCDEFTKEFLMAQGVELNEVECKPVDPVATKRLINSQQHPLMTITKAIPTADNDKLRRYLEFQGKVLSFDCILDETDRPFGECMTYKMYYFLEDDTIAVRELKENREGRDHFPMLLKRTKLPKNWKQIPVNFPVCFLEHTDNEITEYYQPKDLRIGNTIFIYGRKLLLLDCDKFTRQYFNDVLREPQDEKLSIKFAERKIPQRSIPDYLGLGTPEDSLSSCFGLVPKPPRKDTINYLLNANKSLRFGCILDSAHPENDIRKFILKYNLADGTIQINEPPIRNSGIIGGKFLSAQLIMKPNTNRNQPEYYTAKDFAINSILTINNHRFKIVSADLYVYRYMQQHPELFSIETIDGIRNYCLLNGNLNEDIKNALQEDCLQKETLKTQENQIADKSLNFEIKNLRLNETKVDDIEKHTTHTKIPLNNILTDDYSHNDDNDIYKTESNKINDNLFPNNDIINKSINLDLDKKEVKFANSVQYHDHK